MFPAGLLSRFMSSPSNVHMGIAKRVLKYIRGTTDLGISGYVFTIGTGAICWNAKKQEVVAQSTAEAEYISLAAVDLFCDNKSAIAIAQNPVQHGRTKHINVKFHAIREAEKNLLIKVHHCSTEVQLADLMTKALPPTRLEFLKTRMGMSKANIKEEC